MRKNVRLALVALVACALVIAAGLTACGQKGESSSFESGDDLGKVAFEHVTDEVAGTISIPWEYAEMKVELDEGTVNVTVSRLDASGLEDDSEAAEGDVSVEGEVLYEGVDLASGSYSFGVPGGGDCLVTISSADGATGTITFAEGVPQPV